jgi:glycosyltransferase involved in cell wall biosynthesis
MKKILIVTPVYEDRVSALMLFKKIHETLGGIEYIIAVDDGSVKTPLDTTSIKDAGAKGEVVKLKRNVGHQMAISIGLSIAAENSKSSDLIIIMDSDGEDKPDSIPVLVEAFNEAGHDLVTAGRNSRVETFRFKLFYFFYKIFFNILTGKSISFGNFMLMSKLAAERLVTMSELPIHVASTVIASKLRYSVIPIDRGARYEGQSKMNFAGLVLHGIRALMVFADNVLVRVSIFSFFIAFLTTIGAGAAVFLKIYGWASEGWFSIALGILTLVFLQTLSISFTALMFLILSGYIKNRKDTFSDYDSFIKNSK